MEALAEKTATEGSGSCALTAEEVVAEVAPTPSGFSCSCLVLFGIDCGKLKEAAEVAVEVVALSCYSLIHRHYHRNADRDFRYSLSFVSSFSFSDWRELKPKSSPSLSSRCSSFAHSCAPIVPSPTEAAAASEEPPAESGSS